MRRLEADMGIQVMADSDDIKSMKDSMLSMEKAVTELAVIQREASKREERLYVRMDKLEQEVKNNTNTLWKFTGGISALVFAAGMAIKFL